jgi:hypothetical protein
MEKQEKIIRQFFSEMINEQGKSPKELPPRAGD